MDNSRRYFRNTACEYFPCHETDDTENFNCLFCFCPLYCMGAECGGDFRLTPDGVKDCTPCLVPHKAGNYQRIMDRLKEWYRFGKRRAAQDG